MKGRPFTLIAAVLLGLVALVHVYRIMTHFQVIIGTHEIAQSVSWAALVITAALSIGLFREALR
jgi:hypothetical protein